MSHANAALTPKHRLRLARLVVEEGWTPARAAEFFNVTWRTADKWAQRYRDEGPAGMADRSSARHTQHAKTPRPVVRKIVHLRWKQRLGPVPIATRLGMPASTVHAVLKRCRLNRLSHIDRATGEPARRYERERPGELIHVDVTKFGNIPDGGGWRYLGKQQGHRNRQATRDRTGATSRKYYPKVGTCFVHTVIDDYSRVAYAEIHDDEKAVTAAAVLHRAVAWFAERGVTVERVLSDNGSAYRSFLWRETCDELGITAKRTQPYRPQTNGKIERLHRTLADGWAYKKLYTSEAVRRAALSGWLHQYNHHRPHSALGGRPPITRLDNLAGHHS
ncbi:MAG TPA: IS481 family transposase [Streptomyces sp.]|nr:IS481 family transposase [Streptomyces sp.]